MYRERQRPAYFEDTPHAPEPESRFIPPDDRCPEPNRWHSTDGDSTELEVSELIAGLVRGLQPRLTIETGAAFGQTTRLIAQALTQNGHGELITYECDEDRRAALPPLPQTRVEGSSLQADLGSAVIDFAFLDSFYETRIPEFLHLRRWMRSGTIVAFHDTRPEAGAHRIRRSLREEIGDLRGLRLIDLPTPRGLTLGEVL